MAESGSGTAGASASTGGESSSQASQGEASAAEGAVNTTDTGDESQEGESGESKTKAPEGAEGAEGAEAAAEEGAEVKEEKPKHKYADRLTKAFPDRKFEKDEDYDTALDEHLTGLEGYKEKGQAANQKLLALFDSEPSVREVIGEMIQGASFRSALARHFSAEDFTPQEGEPDYETWGKNAKEREDKAKKRSEFERSYADNLKAAEKEVETFGKEHKMDEKSMDEFLGTIDGILGDFNNGKITKDTLTLMRRAMTYDKDIADAREEGRIAGRNEKIVAKKDKETDEVGDGLPRPDKASDTIEDGKKENYFSGLRDRMEARGFLGTER